LSDDDGPVGFTSSDQIVTDLSRFMCIWDHTIDSTKIHILCEWPFFFINFIILFLFYFLFIFIINLIFLI